MSEDKDKKDEGALTEIGEEDQDIIESGADIQATLEKLGKEKPDTVTEIMAMMGTGPMPNPLHQKMNEGHITQVKDNPETLVPIMTGIGGLIGGFLGGLGFARSRHGNNNT